MKSGSNEFSIQELEHCPQQTDDRDGVRNFMDDDMRYGDPAFFYHSNMKVSGVIGITRVTRESHPKDTAFDPEDPHYDPDPIRINPASVW